MKNVSITNYGITEFNKEDIPIESLLLSATRSLFEQSTNLKQNDIDAVLVSTNDNTKYLGAILSELSGIRPKISHTVESLCNSGSNAVVAGYSYISSGLAETVLVCGAERYDSPGQILEWDKTRGEFKHPIFWSSIFTKACKREFGITEEDLAYVPVKNHRNAQDNPYAFSNQTYSIDDVLNSKKLTDDLRILDCSRPCSGASAVLLVSEDLTKKYTDTPVWIKGIGQRTESAGFTKNKNFTSMMSTKLAAKTAMENSGLQISDVDVAEIHDAFSICEFLALQDLGFVENGNSANYIKTLYETDNRKINPRGGLIGAGHPLGATGIAQISEITQQLQGHAEKRQIENARVGLVHNMSAAATSSTVLIMQN